jgi:TolA-binding protein
LGKVIDDGEDLKMKSFMMSVIVLAAIIILCTSCGEKKPEVSEDIDRDVETLNNRINDLDKQLDDLKTTTEALDMDLRTRLKQINDTIDRVETSRAEARDAVNVLRLRIQGKKALTVAKPKALPPLVRILLVIIIVVLLVIVIQRATARRYAPLDEDEPVESKREPGSKPAGGARPPDSGEDDQA